MTQTWEHWRALWSLHSRSDAFERRVGQAVAIAKDGAAKGRMYGAMSGGKDSLALACVLDEADVEVPWIHAYTPLEVPGQEAAARACAEALGFDLEIVEPPSDVFEFLRMLPHDQSILDRRMHTAFRNFCASGNMLTAAQYERGYEGVFTGMRADESRGRRANRIFRGPLYQITVDGSWMCHPLSDWSARDVWAMLAACDVEPPPHYQRLLERFGVSPESAGSRVDNVLVEDSIAAKGSLAHTRVLYPELWRRMVAARPELERST